MGNSRFSEPALGQWAHFFALLLEAGAAGQPTGVKFIPGRSSKAQLPPEQKLKDGTMLFGSSGSTPFPLPPRLTARAL